MTQTSSSFGIKICGMRDPENIVAVAALKPEFLGFIFYEKSPRCVRPETLAFLAEDPLQGIDKVGVFVNAPCEEVIADCKNYHLDVVQLHGEETPEYCITLKKAGLRVIKAFGITPDFDFSKVEGYDEVDFHLFDTASSAYGGSGEAFHWNLLNTYTLDKPFFLSGGISSDHVEKLKSPDIFPAPYAIDINSRFESSPGHKDISRIRHFMQNLRS